MATVVVVPAAPARRMPRVIRSLLRDRLGAVGLLLIAILVLLALFGPWIAPFPGRDATGAIDVPSALLPPSAVHPFGTDELGRDVYSRVVLGARPALVVSLLVVGIAVLVGVPLGALAGYRRGRVDGLIMRTTDLFLAFPPLLLAMAIVAALGPGLEHAALALAISWWPWYARIARSIAVSLREQPFVDAARAIGVGDRRVVGRHIIPNALAPIVVQATIDVGTVILAAGSLAFIGLGARPPQPDWGLMVADGRALILDQWWVATFPGMAIFVTVLAFNLVGDVLLRVLDPRQGR